MNPLKDISDKITSMLDELLPKEVRCVFVLVDTVSQEISAASDMDDPQTIALLEAGISTLKNYDSTKPIDNIDLN